jgi:hypothetical protein
MPGCAALTWPHLRGEVAVGPVDEALPFAFTIDREIACFETVADHAIAELRRLWSSPLRELDQWPADRADIDAMNAGAVVVL